MVNMVHNLNYLQRACQILLVVCLLITGSMGCSRRYHDMPAYLPFGMDDYDNHSVGRFKTSFLAEQIDDYYRGSNPGPLGVTTFVNVDDLYNTSTFGRMLSEQMMSELAMRGFDVIELRHSDAVQFLNPNGEFGLSRDVAVIRHERDLGGVVVGTYTVSPERVYINARLLEPSTSLVLSAGSVEMSKSKEIARLLRGGSLPTTMERIPVRHLGNTTYPMYLTPAALRGSYEQEEAPTWNWENQPSAKRSAEVSPKFPAAKESAKPKGQ